MAWEGDWNPKPMAAIQLQWRSQRTKFWDAKTVPELKKALKTKRAKNYSRLTKAALVKRLVDIDQGKRPAPPKPRREQCKNYVRNSPKCQRSGKLSEGSSFRKGNKTVYFTRRTCSPKRCLFCKTSPSKRSRAKSPSRRSRAKLRPRATSPSQRRSRAEA